MIEPSNERLAVIDDPRRSVEALDALQEWGTVTQRLPPRLVLVVASGAPPSGVSVHDDDVPGPVYDSLSPSERRFVDAWRLRRRTRGGDRRRGDGLDWDAPGFDPPDVRHP